MVLGDHKEEELKGFMVYLDSLSCSPACMVEMLAEKFMLTSADASRIVSKWMRNRAA